MSSAENNVTRPVVKQPMTNGLTHRPAGHKQEALELRAHMKLLSSKVVDEEIEDLSASPIITAPVLRYGRSLAAETQNAPFTQYGLLGGVIAEEGTITSASHFVMEDPRVLFNTVTPSSVFICGSQGSGKSHTLCCLLENCLVASDANVLRHPLRGLVFHYDPWVSDTGGSPCEAAYLCSAKKTSVRVLCSPANVAQIKRIYQHLPKVEVEELRIDQSDLNTTRMNDLMAVNSVQGGMPLYLHVISRILREMRAEQQQNQTTFNYREFKRRIMSETLVQGQAAPLQQRLDTLESFLVKEQVVLATQGGKKNKKNANKGGNDWTPKAGQLTIVDLSCPCVTSDTACLLFNISLSLFLEQPSDIGRVVALDEAHKYMTDTAECHTLTEALLASVRLQRHLGARVIISTQEPTISPRLLDLCSVVIVHRFSSPDWLQSLKRHLAGASILSQASKSQNEGERQGDEETNGIPTSAPTDIAAELFSKIIALRRGEALLFSPSAVIGIKDGGKEERPSSVSSQGTTYNSAYLDLIKLCHRVMKVRIRQRVTTDGGRSILAK